MRTLFQFLVAIGACWFSVQAQPSFPHQPSPPPVNPYHRFERGLYIDCTGDIIHDMVNGNALGLDQQLTNYLLDNYISTVILCDLENSGLFDDAIQAATLKRFIENLRLSFPGISVLISGNIDANATVSPIPNADVLKNCFPKGNLNGQADVIRLLSNTSTSLELRTARLCRFLFKAALFSNGDKSRRTDERCNAAFDGILLQHPFWNHKVSLVEMQEEFTSFISVLSFMQILKCRYPCLRFADAEFLPTDLFKLQAWTSIDQITEADPLVDRLIVQAYTYNADHVFDLDCKWFHYLADRFSKPATRFFIGLSAESSTFAYCNSPAMPEDYLGNYLNGTVAPSGNMYSVEKTFLDKFNDPNYFCSACSCKPFQDDHYSSQSIYGNILQGAIWKPYTMLNSHNLTRQGKIPEDQLVKKILKIELFDMGGKIAGIFASEEEQDEAVQNKRLHPGLYLSNKIFENGKIDSKKIIVP